ncbi:MAG TPA: prolipoprotein diacylglyceryl transferase [Mobilitalea sp.]|nr:prolipoprotein diacylglyceryl transferase [Mobilitalea sp.]
MLPTIHIFGRTIAMYGLMIAIGLIVGILIMVLRSKKYCILREDALFSSFFGCIGLFLGAKLLFLVTMIPVFLLHWETLTANPSLLMSFLLGGYIFYGGLIGAVIGIYIYCRAFHTDFVRILDLTAPSIPIIHGFGRIGCFFAGCCYGIEYSGPGKVIFQQSISAPNHVSLLPIQLVESGINFLAGILLIIYAKPSRKPGRITGIYIIYYAVLRFVVEFFRGDIVRGFFFGLSTSQWISVLLLPVGIWMIAGLKANTSKHNS